MTLPNLERKDLKLFANDAAAQDNIAVFGSLASANPQFSKDIEAIQNLPAFLQGWAGAITGDASPALEDFNALFYVLFYQMAYLFQKGVAQWKATTDYYKGSFTTDGNGAFYASVVDNNVGNDPATDDGTHWNKFPTPVELASKVSKAGDTMSGQLVMENGSNGIRFNGATADNYYYVKPGSGGLIEGDGTNENRILTTDDINKDISAPVYTLPDYNALIKVTIPYTVEANGYILIDAVDSTYTISINGLQIFQNYDLGNSTNSQTGYLWVKKGDVVTSTGGQNLKFMPAIQVPFSS